MSVNLSESRIQFFIMTYLVTMETYFTLLRFIYLKERASVMAPVGWFSVSTVWVLGITVRSSGLVARAVTK